MSPPAPMQEVRTGQPATSGSMPIPSARSTAVDFFRGLGLWIVFVDHIDPNIWSHLTLWRFGFSDFAEIFVFLSGFISVGSYQRALASGVTSGAVEKLGRRMARLYVAHIASLLVSLALLGVFARRGLRLNEPIMYVWMQHPAKYLLRVLTLTYEPHLYSLLPLYIVVSPLLLLAAMGLRRAPKLTLCISGGLWLASQFPVFDSRVSSPILFFHPLAWQFLFVLGAASRYYCDGLKTLAQARWTTWVAAAIVAGSAALKIVGFFPLALPLLNPHLHAILLRDAGKALLAPYRLAHFLALLVCVHALTRDRRIEFKSFVARLAIASGADSLFIYCCTLVLAEAANLTLAGTHGGPVLQLALSASGVALLCAVVWLRRGGTQLRPRAG